MLSCASVVIRAISVSYNVYLSSEIGPEGMGLITLIYSVYGFFITLATSGIGLAVTRLISTVHTGNGTEPFSEDSSRKSRRILKSSLIYALIFSVTASLILFISAENIGLLALGDRRTVPSVRILSLSLTPIAVTSVLYGYFNGVRRVYKNIAVQICEQGVKISLATFLISLALPKGVEHACFSVVLAGVISEGASMVISALLCLHDRKKYTKNSTTVVNFRNKAPFSQNNDTSKIDSSLYGIFTVAFPVGVSAYVRSALATVEHIAIPWGLKQSGGVNPLGSYGILHGMVFPVLLFPSAMLGAFSSLLIPELSSLQANKNTDGIRRAVSSVMSLSLLFSVGVSGIFISFSHEIGIALYGSNEAGEYIRILSPLIPLMYLDGAVDSMLKGLGEQMYCMRVNIADSLISVILIVTMLPVWGMRGYVAVIFITELFNTSLSIIRLLYITGVSTPCLKWIGIPLFSVILSTVATRLAFDNVPLLLFLGNKPRAFTELLISSIIYVFATLLLRRLYVSRN
ncbi:MAG: oligosaccharide flippase family protein [Clostridia bacterium]|nr:oligosaccharide flippase family protein [Clostridia bacterium]